MRNVYESLELLSRAAKGNPDLRKELLATRTANDPMDAFCKISCAAGFPVTVGELFAAGQEYSDNQCKSTNGGNPSPYEYFDDTYGAFLTALE